MANDTCVALQCEIKDIFDKDLKKPVLKQIKETIEPLVNKAKGFTFDDNCKDGWLLTATVVELTVDDPKNPTTVELSVVIRAVPHSSSTNGFNAKGHTKVPGIRANKMEKEVTSIVGSVFTDVMNKQVIPQLLKS
jgi:hypothetical protein